MASVGETPPRAPGTLPRPTHGCGCRVGLRSRGICPALTAVAPPPSPAPGDPGAPPPRNLNLVSSGSRRPRPKATKTRRAKFPTRESESDGQERGRLPHPGPPFCLRAQADLPGSRGAGARGPRHCATPALGTRVSSATRASPESLSFGQEWDSAEVPVTPEKGGAPPPRSRRGSSAPGAGGSPHRAGDPSSVARTPAGRGSLSRYPLLCSCPARKTHTRRRRNGVAK